MSVSQRTHVLRNDTKTPNMLKERQGSTVKLHEQYYVEKAKVEKLIAKKNQKSDFYNGIYDRYTYPVLTREHIPVEWRYDVNPQTNPDI